MIVPSYISNSDSRIQTRSLAKTWVFAILIIFFVLGSWEIFWRIHEFKPYIEDNIHIWHLQRSKVSKNTRFVFMGSSRAQLGLHPDVFTEQFKDSPVNLSIDGNPPFPVLNDLANDDKFSGIVFCSILPQWLAEKTPEKNRSSKWVRKYHKKTILSQIDTYLSILIQKTFVFKNPGLSPKNLTKQIKKKQWPALPYSPMRLDRFREARFTNENTQKILFSRIKREKEISQQSEIISIQEFYERINAVKKDIKKIKQRGGKVIFIRMPSSGKIREIEAATWPRVKYWDVFADNISEPAIHFEDFRELKNFHCPDGSHLDVTDAKKFTSQLLRILSIE
jgi:hypothetical protein